MDNAAAGYLHLLGDAADDEILEEAGIQKARGLVAAVDSDADNTFVILSARVLRPDMLIVGRANSEESLRKVRKAGADHVISPFRIEEFALNGTCEIVGKSIAELEIRRRTGATILAVRHGDSGLFDTNPSPEITLDDGDVVIAIGTPADIANLEELFACRIPAVGGHSR